MKKCFPCLLVLFINFASAHIPSEKFSELSPKAWHWTGKITHHARNCMRYVKNNLCFWGRYLQANQNQRAFDMRYLTGFIRDFNGYDHQHEDRLTLNEIKEFYRVHQLMHDPQSLEEELRVIVERYKDNYKGSRHFSGTFSSEIFDKIIQGAAGYFLLQGKDLNKFMDEYKFLVNQVKTQLLKWLPKEQVESIIQSYQKTPPCPKLGAPVVKKYENEYKKETFKAFLEKPRFSTLEKLKTTQPNDFEEFCGTKAFNLLYKPTAFFAWIIPPYYWEGTFSSLFMYCHHLQDEFNSLWSNVEVLSWIYFKLSKNQDLYLDYDWIDCSFQKDTYALDIIHIHEAICTLEKMCYALAANIWQILRDKETQNSHEWKECDTMFQKFRKEYQGQSNDIQKIKKEALCILQNLSDQEKEFYPSLTQQIRILQGDKIR